MKRTILTELLAWKNSPERKPLVLKGVRQCGKTYLLNAFAQAEYEDAAYFNFEETPSLASVFEQDLDARRILFELGLLRGKSILPGKTLLILDEIQACDKALTSMKYFCENAREYHVACAGSLLGIAIHRERSFPVGKVDFLTLYPMSFYEFVEAAGESASAELLRSFRHGDRLPDPLANKLTDLLRQYYIVGGMPEAVDIWRRTRDISRVERVQQQILSSYELDFAKHAPPKDFPKLTAIWSSIPQQLAKENSKFIFSHVKKGWRAKDLEDALQWLIAAGLVHQVRLVEKPFFPLAAYEDAASFKLYLCDVGLLRALARVPVQVVLDSSPLYTEFKGAMTENYALGELVKAVDIRPYYWRSGNTAEVDFLIQCADAIVPIEVKSERNVKARSLAEYRKKYQPRFAVKASLRPETTGDAILKLPLYLLASLPKLLQAAGDGSGLNAEPGNH